jgi:hypothetical protein
VSTADIDTVLKGIAVNYVKASYPNRKVWVLQGSEDDPTFHEALALKLFERFGAGRTGQFILTDAGQRRVMQLRE